MNISKRLDKLVQTADKCRVLADIGCDHGYVGISAIQRGKADTVIAADVAAGPLNAARINAESEGVTDRMHFVISDGFSAIPDESGIQCAVIAGMGGILMRDILKAGRLDRFKEIRQLVLSPQSDIDLVRRHVIEVMHGKIVCEHVMFDEGKYYFILDVRLNDNSGDGCVTDDKTETRPVLNTEDDTDSTKAGHQNVYRGSASGHEAYDEAEYYYGKNISDDSVGTYIDYLHFRQKISEKARKAAAAGGSCSGRIKAAELGRQLEYIQTILSRYALNYPAEAGEKEELKRHD